MTHTNTNPTLNTVRTQTARLLATENITVIQDGTAQTAYFDLQSRTLCLPVWQDMSNEMYDMLIGHEVGHALFTPNGNGGWVDAAKHIAADAGFAGVEAAERTAQTYLNIVEDARIERLIKERFPGMRRDFFAAYTEFAKRDLFSLKGRNPNTLGLADRLNIHFKIGFAQPVNFSPAEAVFVGRMESATTWEDVVEIAADLYEFQAQGSDTGSGNGVPRNGSGEGEATGKSAAPNGTDASGKSQTTGGTDSGAAAEGGENSRPNGENGSDSGSPSTDSDSGQSKAQTGEADAGASASPRGSGVNRDRVQPKAAETAGALDRAMSDNAVVSRYNNSRQYSVVGKINENDYIVPFSEFISAHRRWESGEWIGVPNSTYGSEADQRRDLRETLDIISRRIDEFTESTKGSIQAFVREFEMRKTADEHRRTVESKSGRLDMDQAWKYRISDSLFKTATTMRDGKNHGFVMFIDWSGSMQPQMEQTMRQLFILFQFCKKVGVPFDVYAFGVGLSNRDAFPFFSKTVDRPKTEEIGKFQHTVVPKNTEVYHILTSRASARDLKDAFRYCLLASTGCSYRYPTPIGLGGSTPLQSSLLIGRNLVREFQKTNRVQIVNLVVLTDGDATDHVLGYNWGNVGILRENHNEWAVDDHNPTGTLLKWVQDTTGCNTVGIFVSGSFTAHHVDKKAKPETIDEARKAFKRDGWCALPSVGYSEYFLLRGQVKDENEAMDQFEKANGSTMTTTQIKNAYMKAVESRKASRGMVGRFVEIVA